MNRALKILFTLLPLIAYPVNGQITIDSLSYETSMYGDVLLRWTPPTGVIISQYSIYRGTSFGNMKLIAEIHSSTARQYTDFHKNVIPGSRYIYGLEAIDGQGQIGLKFIEVLVTPPPSGLHFISEPPTTAFIGMDYWYFPQVNSDRAEDVEYTFGGKYPDGMQLNYIAGGILTSLYWRPNAAGQYRITLVATHKKTKAVAVQEFSIKVASQPGYIDGSVRSVSGKPLSNALVRVFQVSDAMMYETNTDSLGNFQLPAVQAGEILAFAKAYSNEYFPQWYSLGRDLREATPRILKANDTLTYHFYLLPSIDKPTYISGYVHDMTSNPIEGAKVSFVRKSNFIHIGDTTNITNPTFLEKFAIDTSVTTDAKGYYEVTLKLGTDYYAIVQKSSYFTSFNPDNPNSAQTNAMEARAIKVRSGMSDLNFTLYPTAINTENRIIGTIASSENGINKQAVVILIDAELKRGAGGGHTYKRYKSTISDPNGYYSFDNLSFTTTFNVLAIPLEKDLAPMYFTSGGGTTNFKESEDIRPLGTVQNIDFSLKPTTSGGVGCIFGRVMMKKDQVIEPAPGTLLFAESRLTKQIIGYAISDSTGWYSISGLPAGDYQIYADHPSFGAAISPVTSLVYKSFNIFLVTEIVNFLIDVPPYITSIESSPLSDDFVLFQNYPNPFNPTTTIRYAVPNESHVCLRVCNSLGQEVARLIDERVPPGYHSAQFDASNLPTGLYYYQLQSSRKTLSKRMILIK